MGITIGEYTIGEYSGAGDGIRTRDTELGKLVLYQLSYARTEEKNQPENNLTAPHLVKRRPKTTPSQERPHPTRPGSNRKTFSGVQFSGVRFSRVQDYSLAVIRVPAPPGSNRKTMERAKRFELSTSSLARKRSSQLS